MSVILALTRSLTFKLISISCVQQLTACTHLTHQSPQPLTASSHPSPHTGGVTLEGLKHNVAVGILFIASWLQGQGHYIYKGAVEDSATAEISRSQVWQWIRHRVGSLVPVMASGLLCTSFCSIQNPKGTNFCE